MQRAAPTVGRILVMVFFTLSCFGLLLFLWLAFGGTIPLQPEGYRFTADFQDVAGLTPQADVRISGVNVGKVTSIETEPTANRTRVTIQLDDRYAPLRQNAKAILRQKSLLGEVYVEIAPGTAKKTIPEGGHLADSQIAQSVRLDQIYNAFNAQTRQAFQSWMQNSAIAYTGRSQDLSDSLGNLPVFAQSANQLLEILNQQSPAVSALVRNSGNVLGALNQRGSALSNLIVNSNSVFRTTAERNSDLQQTFIILPTFQREARATIDRTTRFLVNANPLINQLKLAARELSPTLIDLKTLAPNLQALFIDLRPVITLSRTGLPALDRILDEVRPVLGQLDPALRNLIPALDFLALYREELNAFFANVPASTQAVETPSGSGTTTKHYLRTTNPVAVESLAAYQQRIPSNRPNPYQLPGGFRRLNSGLLVYENRQCNSGRPQATLTALPIPFLDGLLPPPLNTTTLRTLLNQFIFTAVGGTVPAPPCVKQGPFHFQGRTTQYPQVHALPPQG